MLQHKHLAIYSGEDSTQEACLARNGFNSCSADLYPSAHIALSSRERDEPAARLRGVEKPLLSQATANSKQGHAFKHKAAGYPYAILRPHKRSKVQRQRVSAVV